MEATIKKILAVTSDLITVEIETEFGSCIADWESEKPENGKSYDIEFEVEDTLIYGKTIYFTESNEYQIKMENGNTIFVGNIDAISDDGVAAIKMGDSILLVEVENFPVETTGFVKIVANNVKLYDTYV
jgi:hypothetical protein